MRSHYIIIGIILLALTIGSSSAITKISLTEINWSQSMPAALIMGSNKVTTMANGTLAGDAMNLRQGWEKLNKTEGPDFWFDGTTGAALSSYITAHGEGTYHLKNKVTISTELTISTNYVKIVGDTLQWTGRSDSKPYFSCSMATGNCINITANCVTLDHPTIIFSNATSVASAICINSISVEVLSPSIFAGKGKAIDFERTANYWHIMNPNINMDATTGTGYCFYFNPTTAGAVGWIEGGMINGGAYGCYVIVGSPIIDNSYFMNQSTNGMYFAPSSNDSCNAYVRGTIFDYISGNGIGTSGVHEVADASFENCWVYVDNANMGFYLQATKNWLISDCPLIMSVGYHGIYIQKSASGIGNNGLTIKGCHIDASTSARSSIYVTNQAVNTNFIIAENRLTWGSTGYGVEISGASIGTWTVIGNQGSIHGTAGTGKVLDDNRDT